MDADEKAIVVYLRSYPGQFVSGREICRRAGGKWKFRENPEWAAPVLARMVERSIIESDATAHYRLIKKPDKKGPRKWVSPQIRRILEQSGKEFGEVIMPEDGDDDL